VEGFGVSTRLLEDSEVFYGLLRTAHPSSGRLKVLDELLVRRGVTQVDLDPGDSVAKAEVAIGKART